MGGEFGVLEDEGATEQQAKPEYHPKAHLVLKGSEQYEWGVVMDCQGCINYVPVDAVVVGTWNKYGDGTFWVSLLTPLSALEDRATQLFEELAKQREEDIARFGVPKKTKPSKPRAPKPEGPSIFDQLREGLKS